MYKLLFIFLVFSTLSINQNNDVYSFLNKIINKNTEYKNVTYEFTIKQRINSKYEIAKASVKYQRNPLKQYYRQSYPKDGIEVLFNANKSTEKALVNPNGFPWTSLNLNIQSNELRKGQHHSITEANFDYVFRLLNKLIKDYGTKINTKGSISEKLYNVNGAVCKKLILIDNNFKYKKYIVKNEKNICEIANKLYLSDYMILEKNSLSNYSDIKQNQTLIIPSRFAKKIIIYVNTKTSLPARLIVYDEKGLYEQIDYFNIKTNVKFKSNEFSKDFKEYNF